MTAEGSPRARFKRAIERRALWAAEDAVGVLLTPFDAACGHRDGRRAAIVLTSSLRTLVRC
jgi:hypothetical protein